MPDPTTQPDPTQQAPQSTPEPGFLSLLFGSNGLGITGDNGLVPSLEQFGKGIAKLPITIAKLPGDFVKNPGAFLNEKGEPDLLRTLFPDYRNQKVQEEKQAQHVKDLEATYKGVDAAKNVIGMLSGPQTDDSRKQIAALLSSLGLGSMSGPALTAEQSNADAAKPAATALGVNPSAVGFVDPTEVAKLAVDQANQANQGKITRQNAWNQAAASIHEHSVNSATDVAAELTKQKNKDAFERSAAAGDVSGMLAAVGASPKVQAGGPLADAYNIASRMDPNNPETSKYIGNLAGVVLDYGKPSSPEQAAKDPATVVRQNLDAALASGNPLQIAVAKAAAKKAMSAGGGAAISVGPNGTSVVLGGDGTIPIANAAGQEKAGQQQTQAKLVKGMIQDYRDILTNSPQAVGAQARINSFVQDINQQFRDDILNKAVDPDVKPFDPSMDSAVQAYNALVIAVARMNAGPNRLNQAEITKAEKQLGGDPQALRTNPDKVLTYLKGVEKDADQSLSEIADRMKIPKSEADKAIDDYIASKTGGAIPKAGRRALGKVDDSKITLDMDLDAATPRERKAWEKKFASK